MEKKEIVEKVITFLEFQKSLGVKNFIITPSTKGQSVESASKSKKEMLDELRSTIGECIECRLHKERTNLVFGDGNPEAKIMFVGEAPGRDEDIQGKPFVGRAGKLLTDMIKAMGFKREEVYIANIIKCRPPQNRNPIKDEIEMCEPYLRKQIEIIKPKIIIALGTFAAQTLLKSEEKISQLRGKFAYYEDIKLLPTYHPAFLLRNPQKKKESWSDLKMVLTELGLPVPTVQKKK
ncbi:MAG: uracil-DNA glycosylase [Candidatus Schekmanbacteria bacterium]|nr:MAG: uracil-DNA glycosylase [Candidatus Schekmanbacteria bacterium]